jgi:hypothetical protein
MPGPNQARFFKKPTMPGTKMMLQRWFIGGIGAIPHFGPPLRRVDLPEVAENRGFLLTFEGKICSDGAPVLSGHPALLHG